jgi:hypothetical protein
LIALCRSPAIALVQGVNPSIDRDVMSPAVGFPGTSIVGQREDYALSDEVRRGIRDFAPSALDVRVKVANGACRLQQRSEVQMGGERT